MYCLMCGKLIEEGNWKDVLFSEDPLCQECRQQWNKKKIHFRLDGVNVNADYVYNAALSSALIQFKECGDEALKNVFLYEVKKKIQRKYKGYTICFMPSALEKQKLRGFNHLEEMYSCLHMPMIDPFMKTSSKSQKQLPGYLRRNMVHEIALKSGIVLPKKCLLVDDTITTGSTLKGALHCLNQQVKDIEIYCVSANETWI